MGVDRGAVIDEMLLLVGGTVEWGYKFIVEDEGVH